MTLQDENEIDPSDIEVKKLVDAFIGHLSIGSRVLDIGCGSGMISRYVANDGHLVYGVDSMLLPIEHDGFGLSGQALPKYTHEIMNIRNIENKGSLTLVQCDIFEFFETYKDQTFDGVLATAFLHYLHDLKELTRLVKSVSSRINPGGTLAFSWIGPDTGNTRGVKAFYPSYVMLESLLTMHSFSIIKWWPNLITHSHGNDLNYPKCEAVNHSHTFHYLLAKAEGCHSEA